MLKPSPQDRPLLLALLAIAIALTLNAVVSFAEYPQTESNQQTNIESSNIPDWIWGAAGSLATALIAIYAIRQYKESRRTSERQLRAYLSVVIGGAAYQERLRGLRFEARPVILNNGNTPAYKVRYSAVTKIIPDRVAINYKFEIPAAPPISQASIGPREHREMSAVYPRYIRDSRVPNVALGNGVHLWVWGIVEYEDAFEKPRFTEFCQRLYWVPDGKGGFTIHGSYDPRLGDST